ncbi:MAG TPA: xylulokinase [Pyrinomonadaceae bacterium]|jgi:D-xylulose kinase|nr:xylulokinase [Pyrinomonadaceae bacterium]
MLLLGIDVGTGGSRAVLIDQTGQIVTSATVEHEAFASPHTGWAEQSPDDWWRASAEAIRQVVSSDNVHPEQISAVGLSGQMHGAVLLDERDEVLRPALIWCDQRSASQCEQLTKEIGPEQLIELTCNPALTGFTLPKLLWVRENEPDVWRPVRSVLLPKDYVRFRLTGDKATDVSDASGTLLLNVAKRKWSDEMLTATEISPSLLPRVYESPEITGTISGAASELTGLRVGIPVVAGAGDQAGGAVGIGIVQPGAVSATIGTSGVVFAATNTPALDPKGRVHTFCHAVPGRWHVMGVTQGAGLSLRWFRDQFGVKSYNGDPYDALAAEAAQVEPGSNGAIWAPYLMGERTPHLDPDARAALIGLTASHTRAHVVRAIMEGVAFSLRDSFEIFDEMSVPVKSIRLGGGGARSPLWRQIQADIYGREVAIVEAEEGAAYGVAMLAGVGVGVWNSVDAACAAVVRTRDVIQPDKKAKELLARQYQSYRAIYPALRTLMSDML